MEVDGACALDTMKVNGGVSREVPRLVGAGDIDLLDDLAVEARPEEDLVSLRDEVLRKPHDGR